MKPDVKKIVFWGFFILLHFAWFGQVKAECGNHYSVDFTLEKEFLLLSIQADETTINPIFSCEFLLKYDADVLLFVEYQPRRDWVGVKSMPQQKKGEIKIIQSRQNDYNVWIIGEKFHLGTFKFKLTKKASFAEFVFENPEVVLIEWNNSQNPKIDDCLRWPKKIRIKFAKP